MSTASWARWALVAAMLAAPFAASARDAKQVRIFKAQEPCPATARPRGACPGWEVDHIVPLCAGGDDAPTNMQWLRVDDHRFKTFVDVRECRRAKRARSQID